MAHIELMELAMYFHDILYRKKNSVDKRQLQQRQVQGHRV